MKKIIFTIILSICTIISFGQTIFKCDSDAIKIIVNNESNGWNLSPEINPDIFYVECTKKINKVEIKDNNKVQVFYVSLGQKIDFIILNSKNEKCYTRLEGVKPNVNFTKEYIKKNKGKVIVAIPEVSELVNILMVLHKDAEKEENMFDTKTEYYKEVKNYFKPFLNHPALDTINKYITDLKKQDNNEMFFSNKSYGYYYALKMNACAYNFDKKNTIVNSGVINAFANGYNSFDPMKDIKIFEDFAEKSNFRNFYKLHKPNYDSLIKTYNQLNPILKMQNLLDKKFGFGYGSYVVYFSPFISGAHSTQRFESNGFNQSFMFIAPAEMDKRYSAIMNELIESRVVFTEIDHNYVNPVSDKFLNEINQVISNREKWAKGDATSMYNSPYMVFNEYMTFAVYSLYVNDNFSNKDLLEYLPKMENQMENSRGYINFKKFNRTLLEKYKADKNIKMTDLYNFILKWAEEENK
jgi:hypothetical protein